MPEQPTPAEIRPLLELQQKFYGHTDPAARAEQLLAHFDSPAEAAEHFHILRGLSGEIAAALGLSGGKYLQNFYFQEAAALEALLSELLQAEPQPFRVYLNAHPEKIRDPLRAALLGAGFAEKTDVHLVKSLFGTLPPPASAAAPSTWTPWSSELEPRFAAAYAQGADALAHDWQVVRNLVGGQFFGPLWFLGEDGPLIGANRPKDSRNKAIYTVSVLQSGQPAEAVAFLEQQLLDLDPDPVLHLHTTPAEAAIFSALGYSRTGEELYFDYLP